MTTTGGTLTSRRKTRLVMVVLLALAALVARQAGWLDSGRAPHSPQPTQRVDTAGANAATAAIDAAFAARRSKVWVEGEGEVVHLLADDDEGSRHQRWLLDIASGLTLKFAHNIDLADRVPVARGDTIRFRGRYEYNDKGGVIHWTHHDPDGRIEGGWIERDGRRYE